MGIPAIFTNFNVSDSFGEHAGEVVELTTPKVALKLEEYIAGGMAGAIDIDMGLEKLEGDITWGGFDAKVITGFNACDPRGKPLRFSGAYKKGDSCGYDSVEIQLLGRPKTLDLGTWKKGDNVPVKVEYTFSYYMLTINNIPMIEIDMINNVYKVMGKDLYEEQRKALGQ